MTAEVVIGQRDVVGSPPIGSGVEPVGKVGEIAAFAPLPDTTGWRWDGRQPVPARVRVPLGPGGRSDDAALQRHPDGRGPVPDAELPVGVHEVGLHGGLADPHPARHVAVGPTRGDQPERLGLA